MIKLLNGFFSFMKLKSYRPIHLKPKNFEPSINGWRPMSHNKSTQLFGGIKLYIQLFMLPQCCVFCDWYIITLRSSKFQWYSQITISLNKKQRMTFVIQIKKLEPKAKFNTKGHNFWKKLTTNGWDLRGIKLTSVIFKTRT